MNEMFRFLLKEFRFFLSWKLLISATEKVNNMLWQLY